MNTPPPLGRPKDEELTEKVLKTAYQLLSEQPYSEISLVKVAEMAGVSRKALYSRWQNKCELVIEAFQFLNPPPKSEPAASVRQSLLNFLEQAMAVTNRHLVLFADVLADIYAQPDTLAFFENAYSQPRQQIYRELLEQGIQQGEFSAEMNVPLVAECLAAVIRQRVMQRKLIDKGFIEEVVRWLVH